MKGSTPTRWCWMPCAGSTTWASGLRSTTSAWGSPASGYLHSLPAQVIKVDASLTRDIDFDDRAAALLHSVTLMVRSLGLGVVVEGIERQSQLDRICADEQLLAQGYLLHRPMPLAELLEVLQQPTRLASPAAAEPARASLM